MVAGLLRMALAPVAALAAYAAVRPFAPVAAMAAGAAVMLALALASGGGRPRRTTFAQG